MNAFINSVSNVCKLTPCWRFLHDCCVIMSSNSGWKKLAAYSVLFWNQIPIVSKEHLTITSGKIINKNWGLKSAIHFSSHFVYAFIDIATELLITSKIIPVISFANWTHLNFKSYFSQAYSLSKCVGGLRRTLNGNTSNFNNRPEILANAEKFNS